MVETSNTHGEARSDVGENRRYRLAVAVLIISGTGILLTSIFSLTYATEGEREKIASSTFNALLPLFGTWVGTVLAFYFSSQNLEAASRSFENVVKQLTPTERLRGTNVRVSMIKKDKMVVAVAGAGADGNKSIDLKRDILDKMSEEISRIPVLNSDGSGRYMIRGAELYAALNAAQINIKSLETGQRSLQDLFNSNPNLESVAKRSFRVVSADATLSEAKSTMEADPRCKDIFVTEHGDPGEPVMGWLTDTLIASYSKV